MANETKIGELVIALKIKTEALEKGLETAKKKLQEIEENNKKIENSNKSLDASYIALAATAVTSLMKIGSVIKDCVEEYNTYTQAMSSLKNVSDYTGESMEDLSRIMGEFSTHMTKSDLATTIKNFSLMGFTAKQTEQMIEALTNSAIRNRQANYTVSEAVRVASEGYRQGLSTLSDSAGVTENLSVMLDKYAKSIGKTASQLTEAEQNQAYLNRTMYAAEPFAGAMEEYLESLAGKQGEYSQAVRETQVVYTEALEPAMKKITDMKTGLIKLLGELVSSNRSATAGTTAFGISLLGLITTITLAKKVYDLFKTSVIGANTALLASPVTWIIGGLSALVGIITTVASAVNEHDEAQAKLNETTERYKQIKEENYGYTDKEILQIEEDKNKIEAEIDALQKVIDKKQEINDLREEQKNNADDYDEWGKLGIQANQATKELNKLEKKYNDLIKSGDAYGESIEKLNERVNEYNKYEEEANAVKEISKAIDIDATKTKQQEAAQSKINVRTMQDYLDTVKKGQKSTIEYQNAVKALAEAYPEAANAEGIIIDQAQNFINAEELKASEAWKTSQDIINSQIATIQTALNAEQYHEQVAANMGIAYQNVIPTLQSVLNVLQLIGGQTPEQVSSIKPTSVSKPKTSSGGSKSYSNKALDNYKKELEYKKSLDKLSIQEEIAGYEYALKKLAKTTDEKRELEIKIYDLRKELSQKEKDLLDQQTTDYERYIQDQKNLRGAAYDVKEQSDDLDKIIKLHKDYLNQILKDERLSLDERKQIYEEELDTIRDYEQQKRDLRVSAVDNTVSQLKNAITKQLEEMHETDKKAIEENIKIVEEWKDTRINAINQEYEARIKAIDDELAALDKAEQQKSRADEDADYDKKKLRLEQLIAFEHDAVTKANYEKELAKLTADYQKTIDKRVLDDKKDSLKEQKDLLKEEQNLIIENVEKESEAITNSYKEQLEELDKYYNSQIEIAQKTAEEMLLNVDKNQNQILDLLSNYGDAYEITGQSLGEKLAQGFENALNKVQDAIQNIQDTIDYNIQAKINDMVNSGYSYTESGGKAQTVNNSTIVNQNNTFETYPEKPSDTYRKLENLNRDLAAMLN